MECKGYDVVLSWSEVLTTKGDQLVTQKQTRGSAKSRSNCFLRRSLDLVVYPPHQRFDLFNALNRAIAQFEDVRAKLVDGKYVHGPFGAFQLGSVAENDGPPRPVRRTVDSTVESVATSKIKSQNELERDKVVQLSPPHSYVCETPDLEASIAAQSRRSTVTRIETPLAPIDHGISNNTLGKHADRAISRSLSPQSASSRTNIHESSVFSKTDNTFVHYKLLDFAKLTILAIKGPRYRFTEQGMHHILYPKFFVNDESDDWTPNLRYLSDFFTIERSGDVVILPLLTDAVASVAACNIPFIRVVHSNCCWDTLVVCKIKELIFELVCDEFPRAGSWDAYLFDREAEEVSQESLLKNIRFCILCMVFSIGRFHRSRQHKPVKNPVDSYFVNDDLKVSIHLRKVATNYLNYHLDEYDSSRWATSHSWYENYFLLALLLQIHLDNSFGVFENYDLIYAVGECLVNRGTKEGGCGPYQCTTLEQYLRQVFTFNQLFYASTQSVNPINYSIPERDQQQKYGDLKDDYDLTRKNCVSDSEYDDEEDKPSNSYEITGAAGNDEPLSFTVHFNQKKKQSWRENEGNESNDRNSGNHGQGSSKNEETQRNTETQRNEQIQSKNLKSSSMLSRAQRCGPITPQPDVPDPYVGLGLPESLVRLFQEVIQLTNDKRLFRLKRVTPRNYPRICAETKDKILNWNVGHYWNLREEGSAAFLSRFHEGLFYNVECFHCALQVYFERLIEEVPPAQCQLLVHQSFAAINNLSNTNMALARTGGDVTFTCSFWPLLVCGSDIELPQSIQLRAQCEVMWKNSFFTDYNYWRSKQILFEIWSRQDMDSEHNGFMDLVREWGIVLNL